MKLRQYIENLSLLLFYSRIRWKEVLQLAMKDCIHIYVKKS